MGGGYPVSTTHRSPATVNGEPPYELWSLGEAATFVVAEAATAHVSGRYSGTKQQAGPLPLLTSRIDLRIDIDRRPVTSPVTNRISGDFYRTVFSPVQPGQPPSIGQVYQESWIVDDPQVVWSQDSATITG